MDVLAYTDSARRRTLVGLVALAVLFAALFAATPAFAAEEAAAEETPAAPAEEGATTPVEELVTVLPADEPEPAAAPAVDPAVPVEEEATTPVEELVTALPAEEVAAEPDPVPATPEVVVAEPPPAAPLAVDTPPATPPNAAPDAVNLVVPTAAPDPVANAPRSYAAPIAPPAFDAPEPPPDAVPAAVATTERLALSDSGLGPAIDKLAEEWTKPAVASPGLEPPAVTKSRTDFVEQITAVPAYTPSAAGGFLQLLVAWVAPGDLGGAAVLAPMTQLLFVLVAWMLIRPRPLREMLSRFSADSRAGYRAVVLRPG